MASCHGGGCIQLCHSHGSDQVKHIELLVVHGLGVLEKFGCLLILVCFLSLLFVDAFVSTDAASAEGVHDFHLDEVR